MRPSRKPHCGTRRLTTAIQLAFYLLIHHRSGDPKSSYCLQVTFLSRYGTSQVSPQAFTKSHSFPCPFIVQLPWEQDHPTCTARAPHADGSSAACFIISFQKKNIKKPKSFHNSHHPAPASSSLLQR